MRTIMKLVELDKKKFDNYIKNHPTKSHFLQSAAWGEFSYKARGLKPFYVALIDESEKIVGASLLLKKALPFGLCYLYAPRGFVIDYTNNDQIRTMTEEVVAFAKRKKAIFVKIDPDIIYHNQDYLGEEVETPYDAKKIIHDLKEAGFRHLGFTKNFETTQPRYTFRIDLSQSMETIESHFSKTTKQRIQKSLKLKTEVVIGSEKDIPEFYHLMMLTEARKDFVSHNEEYYQMLYDIFNKENKATLFLGKINIEKILEENKKELAEIEKEITTLPTENLSKSAKNKLKEFTRKKEVLEKEIQKYEEALEKYGKEVTLNAHWIMEYGDKAWVLYAGNHNILTETYANYHTYLEHIKFCKERGLKIYDQFGTIGDLSKTNPRLGLHEFKKKFGGNYIEFIGEFDYVTNKFMYFVFTRLVPFYRKIIKRKSKKEVQNEVSRNQ